MTDQPPRYRWLRKAWKALFTVGLAYLLICGLMLFFENALIHPAPQYPRGDWEPELLKYEDAYFESDDGTKLHGWYVEHPEARSQVIYFHGNGQHVASLATLLNRMSHEFEVSIFAVDWRGYGRSEGKANERGVLADSEAAILWLSEKAGVSPSEIIPHGRSLGGAAAIHVASKFKTRGLIVDETFSSMPDVAAKLYPWLPVRLLMRTKYNSAEKIADYEGAYLQTHGDSDRLVPLEIGMRLYRAADKAQKQKMLIIEGKGHNDPPSPEWFRELAGFHEYTALKRQLDEVRQESAE